MKKYLFIIAFLSISISAMTQEKETDKRADGNEFIGKKIAVFAVGNQYDYNARKRIMLPSGGQGAAVAQSNAQVMTNMMSWYGGKVLNPYDLEHRSLQSVIDSMNGDGDVSALREKAKELSVDYVLFEDMEWMMYKDQLYIYEYQIKLFKFRK